MKKLRTLLALLFTISTFGVKAQLPDLTTQAGVMQFMQTMYDNMSKSMNQVYYFRDSRDVTWIFHPAMKSIRYRDAGTNVLLYMYEYGKNNVGETIYRTLFNDIRVVHVSNGELLVYTPHSGGDIFFRPCSENEYNAANSRCTYKDSRFSSDMKSERSNQDAAYNNDASYGYGSSNSGSSDGYTYYGSTSAIRVTSVNGSVTSSYATVELYKATYNGSIQAKVGGYGPSVLVTNTYSTYLGVSVQGMRYYIVVPGYGTQDYYFFNL